MHYHIELIIVNDLLLSNWMHGCTYSYSKRILKLEKKVQTLIRRRAFKAQNTASMSMNCMMIQQSRN